MRQYPRTSIITPLFNGAKYIGETIESVMTQTDNDWELIVIDDCSIDKGDLIVEKYCQKDSRIKLLRNEENLGPAETRNRGIKAAKGRFIAFLDGDDLWLPNKLEKQLAFMSSNDIPFSFSYYQQVNEAGSFIKNVDKLPEAVRYKDLLKYNYIGCLTAVYDTDFFGKVYMKDIRNRQDYALWLDLVKLSVTAFCVKETLASYRIRRNSISSNKFRLIKYHWHIYYNIEKLGIFRALYLVTNYVIRRLTRG